MAGRKEWDQVKRTQKYIKSEIDPIKLLPALQRADILTQVDCESITATCKQNGESHATQAELLRRLGKRGDAAFSTLVAALRETGHDHAAQLLDPTYQGKHCKMFQVDVACQILLQTEMPTLICHPMAECRLTNFKLQGILDNS